MSIYWIDDRKGGMLQIVRGIFVNLWDIESSEKSDPIKSKIYIFGNMPHLEPDMLFSEADERRFCRSIEDIFLQYCENIDGVDLEKNTFEKNKGLIKDIATFVYKKEDSEEKREEYKRILKLCDSEEFQDPENKKCDRGNELKKLIDDLKIAEDKQALAAVDMMLMKGDSERCMDGKFMVSMELCHQFFKSKIPRFLYSMDSTNKEMMTKWQETYKKVYPEDEIPDIFLREDFGPKMELKTVEAVKELYRKDKDTTGMSEQHI